MEQKNFKCEYALFLLKNLHYLKEYNGYKKELLMVVPNMQADSQKVIGVLKTLDKFTREIIEDVYVANMTWQDVMDKRYVSHTTIARCRKKALSAIIGVLYSAEDIKNIAN